MGSTQGQNCRESDEASDLAKFGHPVSHCKCGLAMSQKAAAPLLPLRSIKELYYVRLC